MSGLWSAEQQAWLAALGHRVLVLTGDETVAPLVEPDVSGARAEARPQAPVREAPARPGSSVPAAPPAARPPSYAEAGAERRPAPPRVPLDVGGPASPPSRTPSPRPPDDALERALLRVTGQRTRSQARAVLERLGVDVEALRGNPAAKRALWRRLRPLQPRFRP